MASKKLLKKNINYLFGDLIDECYLWMLVNPEKDAKQANEIIDEAVEFYDETMVRVSKRKVEDTKKYFAQLSADVEEKANALVGKINSL